MRKAKKVLLMVLLPVAAFVITLGIGKAIHDNMYKDPVADAPDLEENGREGDTTAANGKFHSKVYPDEHGMAPEGTTLEELFGQRFYPTDEIMEADMFDPVMQFDDVILPTDGTITVDDMLTLLSEGSNAINYEFSSPEHNENVDRDGLREIIADRKVSACGEPGDFGYIVISIGMWGYAEIEYKNFSDHELPACECTVTRIFPCGLARENMFLGDGFRMDGEDLTEEEFIQKYLKDYEFGGEKVSMNEKVSIQGKYFTWPGDNDRILLYFPTDMTNAKGIRLDRTYEFVFDEEDNYNYASIRVEPHGWKYAELDGTIAN